MKIIEIKDKNEYNEIVLRGEQNQFLQSWEWGEFQEKVGQEILRLGLEDDEELKSVFTLIKKKLILGKNYFYCPKINIKNKDEKYVNFLFKELDDIAKKENVVFLRLDPIFTVEGLKFNIQRTIDVQPSKTSILDINRGEEEILKEMHQKTRYNIRLSEKKGVKIKELSDDKDLEEWWKVMEETKTRDGFRLHSKSYYQKMFDIDSVKYILAEYNGKIIAGNIISYFGDTATYIHGASSNSHRNVMAPFALQWHAIQKAKERGCKHYDFYGVDEKKWPGVTRFKNGFSGKVVEYPGTYDLVFDSFVYNLYKMMRKVRRLF